MERNRSQKPLPADNGKTQGERVDATVALRELARLLARQAARELIDQRRNADCRTPSKSKQETPS